MAEQRDVGGVAAGSESGPDEGADAGTDAGNAPRGRLPADAGASGPGGRAAGFPRAAATDLLAGGAVVAVLAACSAAVPAAGVGVAALLLAVAAAAAGVGAAILAVLTARLAGDRRLVWLAAAVVGYAVVLLPWTLVGPAAALPAAGRVARLVAAAVLVALLVLAVRPPRRLGARTGRLLLGGGAVLAVLAVAALWLPVGAAPRGPLELAVPAVLVTLGWAVAAAGHLVDGWRRRHRPGLRIGGGLAVLAAAHLYRMVVPAVPDDLVFGGLRAVGLLIVLWGLYQSLQCALVALRSLHHQQQDELAAVVLDRERAVELAAERDHELRNGLAGLAGITHLLNPDDRRHEPLRQAVLAELSRLHTILDGTAGEPDADDPAVDYPVEPVLSGLAVLRRSADRPRDAVVRLRVQRGLRAHGHSALLAQVVTNLLANCDRHAPGAAVTIEAARRGDHVVVTVRDEGPGLSGEVEGSVLDRGIRNSTAGGSGLGLHISRQLLDREGGTLALSTVEGPRGCLATVTVPAATAGRPAGAGPAATSSNR